MPQPLTDVRQISRIAYGFFASKALFAALNLNLFGHLAAGAQPLARLVEVTGVAENRLATLLTALATFSTGNTSRTTPSTVRWLRRA